MNDELQTNQSGISRRTLIKRSAIAGGLVWAAPVVTNMSPAFGQAAGTPGTQDISFVAVLVNCGGAIYRLKWEPGGAFEYGPSFAVDGCSDQLLRNDSSIAAGAGSFSAASASFNSSTGQLTVNLGTCTLVDFVVKCGVPSDPLDQGCQDPEDRSQPNVGDTGSVTFNPCSLPA